MARRVPEREHELGQMLERVDARALPQAFEHRELELAYRRHVFEDEVGPILPRIIVALVITGLAFIAVDAVVVPDALALAVVLRLGLVAPVWIAFLVLALRGRLDEHRVVSWPVEGVLLVVLTFVVLGVVADPPGSWLYLAYVSAFPLAGPPLGRWPTWVAIRVNTLIVASVLVALALTRPEAAVTTFTVVINVVAGVFGVLTGAVVEQFSRKSFLQQRIIAEQEERAHALLLNVLPEEIADRLQEEPGFIAQWHEEVTVLFADIVGFTDKVARYGAQAVIGPLNELVTRFDELADRHGLEKIKTIGDEYMAAAGLPVARDDHADAAVAMARDMLAVTVELSRFVPEEVQLRIGLHCGPLIAGVIGTRKFAYDLWGDTVNVASRMETLSEPGRIQVTAAVRDALCGRHHLEARGGVEVPGRGRMETFWVLDS